MSEDMLSEARALRDAARARFNGRKDALRSGLAERPIATRIKHAAMDHVIDTVDAAKAVAKANVPVIAGTAALLAVWFLRRPLIRLLEGRVAAGDKEAEDVT